jgi:Zn-finger nucleic acid-binding protein
MSERQSIEIDYCPGCRGVWLDRGELDKIIQQSMQEPANVQPIASGRHQTEYRSGQHGSHYDDYRRPKKKESIWRELFD